MTDTISPGMEEKINQTANTLNRYTSYPPLRKLSDNKISLWGEADAGTCITVPTTQQINALISDVLKVNAPYQISHFTLLMCNQVFENPYANLFEYQTLTLAELLLQADAQFKLSDVNGDREAIITPELEENVTSGITVINHFFSYPQQLKMIDYKISSFKDGDIDPGKAMPTQQQISKVLLEVCRESEPYQLVNFLIFISHIALYFPTANIYELELFGLANLVKGINRQFTIN